MAERRTIAVHVLGEERVHLSLAHLGRLKQGRLETLCGKLAVTRLSPFAVAAAKAADRCRVCFGKVDEDGLLKADLVVTRPRKEKAPKPGAEVIDLAAVRGVKTATSPSEVAPPGTTSVSRSATAEPQAPRTVAKPATRRRRNHSAGSSKKRPAGRSPKKNR